MKKVFALILCLAMLLPTLPAMADGEAIYTALYSSEVSTLNYLTSSNTWDQTVGANVVDSLVEYDSYANIMPGLALSWEPSPDELTWTFYLRQGVKWYDHNGKPVAEVTAHDFVAAMKYVLTAEYESSVSYLLTDAGNIVNASEYESGEITDFSLVGIKALDNYTLQYTLTKPTPYFPSCMTYGCFMPAYGPQLEELGADFATDNTKMYYCGAFILSEFEPQQKHVYVKNENNWDAEHVYLDGIVRRYVPDSESTAPIMALRGEISAASLDMDTAEEWLSMPDRADMVIRDRAIPDYSYFYSFNFDPKYDEEYAPEDWRVAVNNSNFRHSIMSAFDRLYALRATEPKEPESVLQNTITPRTFAEVDGVDFTELAPFEGVEANFFNTEKALEYKTKAVEELTGKVTFPIKMVASYRSDMSEWENECILLKQQIESVLGTDYVEVILNPCSPQDFLSRVRRSGMYSFMQTNWGGDFVDPATWADPFAERYWTGDNIGNGYNPEGTHRGNSFNFFDQVLDTDEYPETKAILEAYYAKVAEGRAITTDTQARYATFAAAERILIDNAMVVPFMIYPATYQVSKLNIFEGQYAPFGVSNLRFKYQHLHEDFITIDEYEAAEAEWLKAMGN